MAVHHPLDERLGAPGTSMAIGRELKLRGHTVDFFGYDQAYPGMTEPTVRHQVLFPWRLCAFLMRHADRYDVLDITSGDAHAWARLRPPRGRPLPVIVTRSNGLEHLAHAALIGQVRLGSAEVSRRYPIYHGGWRLWEVKRSVCSSDAVVVLTEDERRLVVDGWGCDETMTRVIPHGIHEAVLAEPPSFDGSTDRPLRLCFIGNWTENKGIAALTSAISRLWARGTDFSLLIAGTGTPASTVLAEFEPDVRTRLRVIDRYERAQLPELLRDSDVLLFPSRCEGFGLAVLEAMAAGVAPVTTCVGVVPSVVTSGINGVVIGTDQPQELARAVEELAGDRRRLEQMQHAAAKTVRSFTWDRTARLTEELYVRAHQRRARDAAIAA